MSQQLPKFKNSITGLVVKASLMIGGVVVKHSEGSDAITVSAFLDLYWPMSETAQRTMQLAYGELKEIRV